MPNATDDPISAFLRDIFDNRYQVIVAYNYQHCRAACHDLHLPSYGPNAPILISTMDPESFLRLRGRRFERRHIYTYYTARWGRYYYEICRELRHYYVD